MRTHLAMAAFLSASVLLSEAASADAIDSGISGTLATDERTFGMEDYDGLIGQDFLRYYEIYFDYAHSRIWLAPNARYQERFGT